MARMIDPLELEGAELVDWYQRSPAEVEAEREAARQDQYDAFVNSIGAPSEPQDDAAGDASGPTYDEAQNDDGNWGGGESDSSDEATGFLKARYFRPTAPMMAPPVMAPPSGLRVAPPLDARGMAPIGAPQSGFFGQHTYLNTLGAHPRRTHRRRARPPR